LLTRLNLIESLIWPFDGSTSAGPVGQGVLVKGAAKSADEYKRRVGVKRTRLKYEGRDIQKHI
jgi:hypothetical protein